MVDLCNYWLNATRGINVKLSSGEITQIGCHSNPPLLCKDGFSVSIQGSSTAYCYPREDNCKTYENVELGYPSEFDDLIIDWVEDETFPCSSVYHYVPVDVVNRLIKKHGGYDLEQLAVDRLSNVLNNYVLKGQYLK